MLNYNKGFGKWTKANEDEIITSDNGCLTKIEDILSEKYLKDECFIKYKKEIDEITNIQKVKNRLVENQHLHQFKQVLQPYKEEQQ